MITDGATEHGGAGEIAAGSKAIAVRCDRPIKVTANLIGRPVYWCAAPLFSVRNSAQALHP